MAEIRAFRAFRYDLGRVGSLGDVIAPPYDVIDDQLQQNLYDSSPYNVIRLILNKEESTDTTLENRYTRAARILREWQQEGILAQDSARALYVYHQEFEVEGRRYLRRGYLARVRIERFGEGRIFPHEETLAGPKADRLRLFHATGMNLSPVFGLYPDDAGAVQSQLDENVEGILPLEATDHLGVISRLWPITDQRAVSAVTGMMGPKPIFIADGHHRYETALRYLDDRRAAGEVRDTEAPANFVLMMLVGINDPGLIILPTHRLLSGLSALNSEHLKNLLEGDFQFEIIGKGEKAARESWEMIQADGRQNLLGFGTVADDVWQLGRFHSAHLMDELAPGHSPTWRELAVSVLHKAVIDRALGAASHNQPQCRYVHLLEEVIDATKNSNSCQLAVLVPPATMKHVEQIAGNLEKMPPKSTYFYPKLLSGLVLNSLVAH